MKKTILTLASIIPLSGVTNGQSVATGLLTTADFDSNFGTVIDSFEGDTASTTPISSVFTTAAGGKISFTTTNSLQVRAGDPVDNKLVGRTIPDGTQALLLTSGGTANVIHSLKYEFASSNQGFGFVLGDFGDGNNGSSITVKASDGTVLYQHDELVDGNIGPANRYFGVSGGTYTNFTIDFTEVVSGPDGNPHDNFFIDKVSVTTVPEPSSAVLLGLGSLGLLLRRVRN